MKTIAAFFKVVFFVCVCCSAGWGYGKTTMEPKPVSDLSVAQAAPDPRLACKIDYEARGKTVSSILKDLTAMTDVKLHCGFNNNDWQVRDRKMNIFAKDATLASIMNSIARVMNFSWTKSRSGDALVYRLVMDRSLLLRLNSEATERERTLTSFYDGISALANCPPEDLAALCDQNPYLYALGSTGTASALNDLFGAVPGVKEAIDECREFRVSSRDLPAAKRQILLRLMSAITKMPDSREKSVDSITSDGDVELYINLGGSAGTQIGGITMEYGRDDLERIISNGINLHDPYDTSYVEHWSKSVEPKKNAPKDSTEGTGSGNANKKQEPKSVESSGAQAEPDDPVLSKKAKLTVNKKLRHDKLSLADYEAALAEAMGVSIVSDDFCTRPDRLGFSEGEVALKAFVKNFCAAFQYDWQVKGSVIELRDKDWFRKRSLQIPQAKIENLRKAVVKNHKLGMDDLVEIGLLSSEQYNMNIGDDAILDNQDLANALDRDSGWLGFYIMLSQSQRDALFSQGINFADLNARQRGEITTLMLQRRSGVMSEENCKLISAAEIAKANAQKEKRSGGAYALGGRFDGLDEWMPLAKMAVPTYSDRQ